MNSDIRTANLTGVAAVEAIGVGKKFGNQVVLEDIDLRIEPGEVVCIVGPSGAGKSTFLRCINHLETVTSGRIELFGETVGYHRKGNKLHEMRESDVARQRSRVGMVFQRFNLFAHMTALENVMLAPSLVSGLDRVASEKRARDLLSRVGLADKADSYPSRLSGGQQQRVAIVRALAMEPELLLFDEPTSALDPEMVGEVLAVMDGLASERRTMVVVTHELGFARRASTKLVFMVDGRIDCMGPTPDLLDNPPTERLAKFVDSVMH